MQMMTVAFLAKHHVNIPHLFKMRNIDEISRLKAQILVDSRLSSNDVRHKNVILIAG